MTLTKGNSQGRRGHRGGNQRSQHGNQHGNHQRRNERHEFVPRPGEERPKKEAILDLAKYQDKQIRVKFTGGREGTLKGYDQLMNLVLDDVKETLRDPDDENILLDQTRDLGTVIARGPLLSSISPVEGAEVISNPFVSEN